MLGHAYNGFRFGLLCQNEFFSINSTDALHAIRTRVHISVLTTVQKKVNRAFHEFSSYNFQSNLTSSM